MKKLLFPLLFSIFLLSFGSQLSAQSLREYNYHQKADDGVLVAYPNPARDFIILKVKDPNVRIQNVTFYSVLGAQVAQYNINMNAVELSLDRLRAGKYLIRYTLSNNTQKVAQIIKL